jgi:hypothetical protein
MATKLETNKWDVEREQGYDAIFFPKWTLRKETGASRDDGPDKSQESGIPKNRTTCFRALGFIPYMALYSERELFYSCSGHKLDSQCMKGSRKRGKDTRCVFCFRHPLFTLRMAGGAERGRPMACSWFTKC